MMGKKPSFFQEPKDAQHVWLKNDKCSVINILVEHNFFLQVDVFCLFKKIVDYNQQYWNSKPAHIMLF